MNYYFSLNSHNTELQDAPAQNSSFTAPVNIYFISPETCYNLPELSFLSFILLKTLEFSLRGLTNLDALTLFSVALCH